MSSSDDDSSVFSSDDEEYLTTSKGKDMTFQDREAMVRRKLLESFYGTSDVDVLTNDSTDANDSNNRGVKEDEADSTKTGTTTTNNKKPVKAPPAQKIHSTDLDSIDFSPPQHTYNLLTTANSQSLLRTNEELSQSIRLLDSTMQTLVYENYSKFIHATDAIRSIGLSVTTSEEGLANLSSAMERMEVATQEMDGKLRMGRENVAEKLRVKRLLRRLTRLLELPDMLQSFVKEKRYRLAMKDFLDAMMILERHSEGFESLKSIEASCREIVRDMVGALGSQVWGWCGRDKRGRKRRNAAVASSGDLIDGLWDRKGLVSGRKKAIKEDDDEDDDDEMVVVDPYETNTLDPPETISEAFECAAALLMYSQSGQANVAIEEQNEDSKESFNRNKQEATIIVSNLTESECKALALESCTKYLERILEEHAIDLQEASYNHFNESQGSGELDSYSKQLFPMKFLDSMLEIATLYGVSFNQSNNSKGGDEMTQEDTKLLNAYVSSWFASFLGHVRMSLLQNVPDLNENQILTLNEHDLEEEKVELENEGNEKDISNFAAASKALSVLLRNVREVASGLSLPEVGLDMKVASSLVEQIVGITEAMVRRRVSQEFKQLRLKVLKDCIEPFVKNVIEDDTIAEGSSQHTNVTRKVTETVQLAGVALSDVMQLVDDTIRNILSPDSSIDLSTSSLDSGMVRVAVEKNARDFGVWLASSLERVAGCDPSDKQITLEVKQYTEVVENYDEEKLISPVAIASEDAMNEMFYISKDTMEENLTNTAEENRLKFICEFIEDNSCELSQDVLTLAMIGMCRLGERNVCENVAQSISSSMNKDKRPSSKPKSGNMASDKYISSRFTLAASRALVLYASMKGTDAASILCNDIVEACSTQSEFLPHGPTEATFKILAIAKEASLSCASAFGGDAMAGSVPSFAEEDKDDFMQGMGGSGRLGAIKGLQLDVARMFTERVKVYPHSSRPMDFNRNTVITLLFKVALKAWIEQARLCTFTSFSYRQVQVDIQFIKFLLPHYVDEDSLEGLSNILNDLLLNVGERCKDSSYVGVSEFYDEVRCKVLTPSSIVLTFLQEEDEAKSRGVLGQFLMRDDS